MENFMVTGQLAKACGTTAKRIADLAHCGVIKDFTFIGNRRLFHVRCVPEVKKLIERLDAKRSSAPVAVAG